LIALTGESGRTARYCAITALGKSGRTDERVIDVLLVLMRDGVGNDVWGNVQSLAAKSLGSLGVTDDRIIDALIALTGDNKSIVCRSAVESLIKLGVTDERVIDRLTALAGDSDKYVRSSAAYALGKLFSDNFSSLLSPYASLIADNQARLNSILEAQEEVVEVTASPVTWLERFGVEVQEEANNDSIPGREESKLVLLPSTMASLESILPAVAMNEPVMLVGPTGAGKSAMVKYLASITNNGYIRINLKDMTDISELVGGYVVRDGQIIWQDSLLVKAIREGYWVVLDEANLAGSGVLERLNQLLDRDNQLQIQEHILESGEPDKVEIHPNFRLFVTMNPSDYAGRKVLSPAFLNRFRIKWIDEPTDTELIELVVNKYNISREVAMPVVGFHHSLKELAEERQLGQNVAERYIYTIRDLQRWAKRLLTDIEEHNLITQDEIMPYAIEQVKEVYGLRLYTPEDIDIFEKFLLMQLGDWI